MKKLITLMLFLLFVTLGYSQDGFYNGDISLIDARNNLKTKGYSIDEKILPTGETVIQFKITDIKTNFALYFDKNNSCYQTIVTPWDQKTLNVMISSMKDLVKISEDEWRAYVKGVTYKIYLLYNKAEEEYFFAYRNIK